jgi:hypothetical protein
VDEGQMRKISMDILLHQFPQTPLVYLSLPLRNISQSSQDSPSPARRIPEELSDTKQLEPRPTPTEEAEIQKGTSEFPSAEDGKEEKEEKEEKEKRKEGWREQTIRTRWTCWHYAPYFRTKRGST